MFYVNSDILENKTKQNFFQFQLHLIQHCFNIKLEAHV